MKYLFLLLLACAHVPNVIWADNSQDQLVWACWHERTPEHVSKDLTCMEINKFIKVLKSQEPVPKHFEKNDISYTCGQVVCPFPDRKCRCAPAVISLGNWDPRPLDWGYSVYSDPKDWGSYPTEQRAENNVSR